MSDQFKSDMLHGHNAALDGLRTLAIVLVLFRHGIFFYYQAIGQIEDVTHPIWRFFINGWVGVDLFYVLSGYLISRSLFAGRRAGIKLYIYKRALRIIPAYYAVLILCVIGAFPFFNITDGNMPWRVLYHALFLQDYFPSDINIVFWTLGVEEKFYLLIPFVIALVIRWAALGKHGRSIALLCGLIAAGFGARALSYYLAGETTDYVEFFNVARKPFHACLEPLLIGVLIAYAQLCGWRHHHHSVKAAPYIFAIGALGIFAILASAELMKTITWYDATLQPFFIALCMGSLIYGGVFGGAPKVFSIPFLRFPARLSYAWYLVHVPLWPLSFVVFKTIIKQDAELVHLPLFLCVFFVLTGLAAAAIYLLIERPFLDIKDGLGSEKKAPS